MLKLSRSGVGLLNSQYRSVLKKCILFNFVAGILLVSQPAGAKDAIINAIGEGSSSADPDVTEFVTKLNNQTTMGLQIGSTTEDRAVGTLYINGSYDKPIYAKYNGLPDYGPWLLNYKDLNIGYQLNNDGSISEIQVTIANRHNQNGDIQYFGGGVVANGGNSTHDSNLKIQGTLFTNNSTSNEFSATGDGSIAAGGVISNFSQNPAEVKNSTFSKNFVMGGGQALGGAIYNGVSTDKFGNLDGVGSMKSTGNSYEFNYAGNDVPAGETNIKPNGVNAQKAYGGAIYNDATFESENDRFNGNYAKGKNALGGAIYNAQSVQGHDTSKMNITGDGTINFNENHVIGVEEGNEAKGGAIANLGKLNSTNNVFFNNYAKGDTAFGGAVYNAGDGKYTSTNETFDRNHTEGKIAIGGAIYNGMLGAKKPTLEIKGTSIFSNNSVNGTAQQAGGGAIFNNGILDVGEITTDGKLNIIMRDNTAKNTGDATVVGGAIENEGVAHLKGILFSGNNIQGSNAAGGAVSFITDENSEIVGSVFENNIVSSDGKGYGGAFSNSNLNGTATVKDTSFISNVVMSKGNASGMIMSGGAISNDTKIYTESAGAGGDKLSILKVIAEKNKVVFSNNIVAPENNTITDGKYIGGAIYNGAKGQITLVTSGSSIVFDNNKAGYGGAIYNESDGSSQTINGTSQTSYLLVNAEGNNIEFLNNQAGKDGGAIYNATGETGNANLHASDGTINFANNTAKGNGGAVANAANANFDIKLGANGTINMQANSAKTLGGAIYNEGKVKLTNTLNGNNGKLVLQGNTAQKGGAIYNKNGAIINATLEKDSDIIFRGNTASAGLGGAIYNEAGANINITLKDASNIVFESNKDDVYNEGTIDISGDLANPTIPTTNAATTAIDNSKSQIILNSTFGGNGTYNISNTQLNIGNGGYINFEPTMNLSNNNINLSSGTYLNLDTKDTLNNNDIYISNGANLTYKADSLKPNVSLANTMVNNGLVNLGDGVLSNVNINTLTSNDGTIRIDVDNAQFKADVITINNKIYGTTNIAFDNSNTLTLNNEKIYFAQTQAEQSLSEYNFVSRINNGIYEISIGHDKNAAVNDWYFYRSQNINPEIIGYIDLPRASVEQTRGLLFDVARVNKGGCQCYRDVCNYKICNFQDNGAKSRLWVKPVYRSGTYDLPVETDISMYGIDFGYDFQNSIRSQFGLFGSWRNGTYENDGKGENYTSSYGSELDITSILGGIYYRHYFGNLYMSTAAYGGQQSADIKADNGASASTDGINLGAQAEIGYDIRTTKRSVLTPSIRATYDYIKFDDLKDNTGKEVEFDAINDIELEAGIKFEYQFNNEHQLPTTGYIKPSVVKTISNGGDVTVLNKVFDETLENDTYGRVEVGADAEIIENFSIGAFGNYTFGSEYNAWGVGGNIRYVW